MRQQIDLIRETEWDVLVILDACRADAFESVVSETEAVLSPASCTKTWIERVGPYFDESGAHYITANPIVDREMVKSANEYGPDLTSVWKEHWGQFTPLNVPSVHPMSVTSVALARLAHPMAVGLDAQPLIVHYLQPHSPYIGHVPLNLSRWGGGKQGLTAACHALQWPCKAIAAGKLTWAELREAYVANLRLAWEAVRVLIAGLDGARIVVTSDHGELLGEEIDGRRRFGHECHWQHDALRHVPWLETVGGPNSPLLEHDEDAAVINDDEIIRRKLEALGYA